MLTKAQYDEIKARSDAFDAWLGNRRSYNAGDVPLAIRVSNDERSAMEVYTFVTAPPTRYFLYIGENPASSTGEGSRHMATTWTGEYLGDVTFGRKYRSNFGDRRIPITIKAINGRSYHGIYYTDAGSYARVRVSK